MAPVVGRPFIEYLLRQIKAASLSDVVLCVGYKRSYIQRWIGTGKRWNLNVKFSIEAEPLGTGGALRFASDLIPDPTFVLLNGDSFLDVNLDELVRFHMSRGAKATVALASVPDVSRYGSVNLDSESRVLAFNEKYPSLVKRAGLINGGIYVFQAEILGLIPSGRPISLEREILPKLIGHGLYGFSSDGYFIDIGVPEDYMRAQSELPKRVDNENSRKSTPSY